MQSLLPEINRLCAEMGRPVVYAATGDATLTALAVQARFSPWVSRGLMDFTMLSWLIFQEDCLLAFWVKKPNYIIKTN